MNNTQVQERSLLSVIRQPDCRHHWVVEQANGPTSWGKCKLCGSRREFFNDPEAVVRLPGLEESKTGAAAGSPAS